MGALSLGQPPAHPGKSATSPRPFLGHVGSAVRFRHTHITPLRARKSLPSASQCHVVCAAGLRGLPKFPAFQQAADGQHRRIDVRGRRADTVVAMAGVFDIELHDVEPAEVDSEDDVIQVEEVGSNGGGCVEGEGSRWGRPREIGRGHMLGLPDDSR